MAKSNKVKFSEEELTKIKEFQKQYLDIQMGYGQIQISRNRLEEQLVVLDKTYDKLNDDLATAQSEERIFIGKINEKYGDGVLDPETGLFTPSKTAK